MKLGVEPSIFLLSSWLAQVEDAVMVTEERGVPFSILHEGFITVCGGSMRKR